LARIGLKVFYLRTRVRKQSQQKMADTIGVRQATLSNIEQGVSQPTTALLIELCKYFDVTPTYLVDEARGVEPLPSERWSQRNSLVTAGMWIEAPKTAVVDLGDGKMLCPLLPQEAFYDDEAKSEREGRSKEGVKKLQQKRRGRERSLERMLQGELRAHPLRRKPKTK